MAKVALQKQTFQAVKLDCFGLLDMYGALMGVVRRTRDCQGQGCLPFFAWMNADTKLNAGTVGESHRSWGFAQGGLSAGASQELRTFLKVGKLSWLSSISESIKRVLLLRAGHGRLLSVFSYQ